MISIVAVTGLHDIPTVFHSPSKSLFALFALFALFSVSFIGAECSDVCGWRRVSNSTGSQSGKIRRWQRLLPWARTALLLPRRCSLLDLLEFLGELGLA